MGTEGEKKTHRATKLKFKKNMYKRYIKRPYSKA